MNTASVRGGFWMSPMLYAFAEASGNHRSFETGGNDSSGYRVSVGIGSDRIRLMRGEVYAGYQQQFYTNAVLGQASAPLLGGRLFWYPTRALTFRVLVDQRFSDSALASAGNPNGFPARITTAQLRADYKLSKRWTASIHGGFEHSAYIDSNRRDNGWRAGGIFTFDVSRSLGIGLNYDYSRVHSNSAAASYTRNAIDVHMRYRY